MMEQVQIPPASAQLAAAAAPASIGYVRIDSLAELKHVSTYSVGAVIFKKDGPGRTAIYTSPVGSWTPVAERLPDDEALVLIALNDDDVWTGYLVAGEWRYVDSMPITQERVTHWMPMPVGPGAAA